MNVWFISYHMPSIDPVCNHCQLYPHDMGVSENSVPLNPMVNDHSPY
jgi:hypothetical protein